MGKPEENRQVIEPELFSQIELLRSTPEREDRVVSQRRERFISEVEALSVGGTSSPFAWFASLFKANSGREAQKNRAPRFVATTVVVVLVAFVMVFGGATATAFASQTALPGDALYPVKTSLELTQVVLTGDAYNRAQLYLRFAQRRMEEITKLLEEGRYKDVGQAADEFETYIQEAIESLQVVLAADPDRGADLSNQVTQALLDYAFALKSLYTNAPEPAKLSVEKALMASQDNAGKEIEVIGVVVSISDTALEFADQQFEINELTEFGQFVENGDTVKVHAILTQDGRMIAREIELADGDGNENFGDTNNYDNANDNGNSNDNMNWNDNDNTDEGNGNDEGNVNGDDEKGNSNEDNRNDNGDDDNGNSNEDNGNDNGDDDNGNNSNDDGNNSNDDGNNNNDDDNGNGNNANDDEKGDD